jgi:trehalose 6-phosphate phosphatase
LSSPLTRFAERQETAGILLDYDGTLSEIVSRPEDATLVPGAPELLRDLSARYRVVAVISGRPTPYLQETIGVEGVEYVGVYGLGDRDAAGRSVQTRAQDLAVGVPGAWVETKGPTVAVHYRQAEDVAEARLRLGEGLAFLAEQEGLELIEGKMVFELVPAGELRKGGAARGIVESRNLGAAMYAGDDLPDLEAFAELDALASRGLTAVKVAVAGPETPAELTDAADIVVEGPTGLLALLRSL